MLETAELRATYRFPSPVNAPELVELEQLRSQLKGDPPDGPFVQVSVDNRQSGTLFAAAQVAVLQSSGEQIPLQAASVLIKEWAAAAHPSESLERWFALADQPKYSGIVPAGQMATVILYLVTADAEPEIARMRTEDGVELDIG